MNLNYEQKLQVVAKFILDHEARASDSPPFEEELGIRATLKPHQVEGVSWLIRRYKLGVNVVLGDEMGLGKTLQAISFLSYLKVCRLSDGPFLVICPLSVTEGWASEIVKFTPKLEVFKYVGDKENRCNLRKKMHEHVTTQPSTMNVLLPFDVLLTSYDIALMDQDFLSQIPWQYAIIDEAQRLKNPSSVIFYEQDWNPQVDKQALQRAHRIGQMNHVLCINLVTEKTVEEVIMRRAERKLRLSINVIGDNILKHDDEETSDVGTGDLKSIIFGLHMLDPSEIIDGNHGDINLPEISLMADKVLALRGEQILEKDERKFEVNPRIILQGHDVKEGGTTSLSHDLGLDEASYLSWVKNFEEVSKSSCNSMMDWRSRRNLEEEKNLKLESARKKAEEKKLSRWKALGYQSLNVKDTLTQTDNDITSATGSVHFVYGDCTAPSNVCSSEPVMIFSCVDTSGHWGHGGMFDALSKLSTSIGDAYEQASEHGDLHLGDLHLIRLDDGCEEQDMDGNTPKIVALAVVQSYNLRRKIPRSEISLPHLESCLSKAAFSAAQNSASIHMPRIGYQDGSDRSEWYTIERLLRKYASIYNINIYVYYYRRSS
ncbi:hypothetical protein PHAVU_008G141500 [Phaseolus vulgaris]